MEKTVVPYAIPLAAIHRGHVINTGAFALSLLRDLPLRDHAALNRELGQTGRYGLVWARTRPDEAAGYIFNTTGSVEFVGADAGDMPGQLVVLTVLTGRLQVRDFSTIATSDIGRDRSFPIPHGAYCIPFRTETVTTLDAVYLTGLWFRNTLAHQLPDVAPAHSTQP